MTSDEKKAAAAIAAIRKLAKRHGVGICALVSRPSAAFGVVEHPPWTVFENDPGNQLRTTVAIKPWDKDACATLSLSLTYLRGSSEALQVMTDDMQALYSNFVSHLRKRGVDVPDVDFRVVEPKE